MRGPEVVIPPIYTPQQRSARERVSTDVEAWMRQPGNRIEVLDHGARGMPLSRTMRQGNAASMKKRVETSDEFEGVD